MSNSLTTFALIALMVVAFYMLILRPQKKRQQELQNTMNSLAPGTRIMTSSGLFGTVTAIGDKQLVMEISPGVELTVLKQAVSRVVGPGDEDAPAGYHADPETNEPDRDEPAAPEPYPGDLGPSATDVTPPRSDRTGGTDSSTKE